MALKKLTFRPGLYRDGTRYTAEGSWYEAQWVRFVQGLPQKMGGWARYLTATADNPVIGTIRSLYRWFDNAAGVSRLGFGTEYRYYVEYQGGIYNITPIRATATLNDPFAVVSGSTLMTVTDAAHGATTGSYVTFSGATSALTNPTAAELNQSFQLTVVNNNTYTVVLPIAATATDATLGGASVLATYEINSGTAVAAVTGGWGMGPYSRGTYGSSYTSGGGGSIAPMRLWAQDSFGDYLLFVPRRNGPIAVYDNSPASRGVDISTLTSDAPLSALYLFVADLQRYVIVLGTNDTGDTTFDPRLIRWASQESYLDWTPSITNSAGSLPIGDGDYLVCGTHTRGENVIWSSNTLYSLAFVGGQEVFGLNVIARNITIASPNAFVASRDRIYWMGKTGWYAYDGAVRPLSSPLQQDIFNRLNFTQLDQVYCGEVRKFNEIIWFYCSTDAEVNDRYVVYNYEQDIWYDGELGRTAWLDTSELAYPIGAAANNLYYQESGTDDASTSNIVPITSYLQSGDVDLDDGDDLMFVSRVIPDMDFALSTGDPSVTMSIAPRFVPGAVAGSGSTLSGSVQTSGGTLNTYTNQVWVRLRGRQMALRVESSAGGVMWRLGATRVDMQPDGRR